MKTLRTLAASALLVLGLSFGAAPLLVADTVSADAKSEILSGAGAAGGTSGQTDLSASFQSVVNIMLFIIGAIAVIVIIIGGILYVVSTGDPAKTKRAKDTILYAVVGLVVAILAYAIVNFVVSSVGS